MVPLPASKRMQQILVGFGHGLSEKEMADRLGISPHTVHAYVKSLYRHYTVSSRAELLALWVQMPQELSAIAV